MLILLYIYKSVLYCTKCNMYMYITRVIAFWVDFGETYCGLYYLFFWTSRACKKEWEFWISKILIKSRLRGNMFGIWGNYLQNAYSNLTKTLIYVRIVRNLLVKHRQKKSIHALRLYTLSSCLTIQRSQENPITIWGYKIENLLRCILAYGCWKLKCLVLHLTSM